MKPVLWPAEFEGGQNLIRMQSQGHELINFVFPGAEDELIGSQHGL